MGTRATQLAEQFEQTVAELAATVEACSDEQWKAVCGAEGWTVAQTAQHVSGQFPLEMEFIRAGAEGRPLPGYTWDEINAKNDGRAARNSTVSRGDVLRELRDGAASTATYLRGLGDEQLDRAGQLGLADGASVSTQQLIEGGVLIDHVRGHLASIRSAGLTARV